MRKLQIRVPSHLLIPFACPKWEIGNISVTGVSTDATYFESDSPVAYVDRAAGVPLRLRQFDEVWPLDRSLLTAESASAGLKAMARLICEFGNLQTEEEKLFLTLYFELIAEAAPSPRGRHWSDKSGDLFLRLDHPTDEQNWVFDALLPLPQAHLYVRDPFTRRYEFAPSRMFKVDFAFWTGAAVVAVEIDGPSHVGSPEHIKKDRLLQRAGVAVVHILNDELRQHRHKALRELLPRDVLVDHWSRARNKYTWDPTYADFPDVFDDGD